MGRIIKVGDGFLKTTLTNAITNAQYGDTILIDNIDLNKETMTYFEIPKGMDIKITSVDDEMKTLHNFNFLINGNLSISNINFNNDYNTIVFNIEGGFLKLDNISFANYYNTIKKAPICNENGCLSIQNSIIFCPFSYSKGTNTIENSTIYGGTVSTESKWYIDNCSVYTNYMRDQWTMRDNSEIDIRNSKFIAHFFKPDEVFPSISINNSLLYLDNSYIDYSDPSDVKKERYLIQAANGGRIKINNSEVSKIKSYANGFIEANFLKTSGIAITDNSTLNVEKLTLDNKFN
ncbi:TPA: ATPase, partial [Staphylococcus pseudintermedius]|nr:ATPase [Staphylococcus pseudintermedius]